ncbi:MAG: hybrid sensor histidine kinase/response regulator [Pseudomonadota bacterium]
MSENQSSVLVVDDTPANLEILTQMLRDRGHRPRPVPSGALALRAAEHEPPDLVLMDINMPEMDGFETCQRLKSQDALSEVPVLFISARSDTYDKVQAFRSGGVDYITKPFDLDEVTARVETHLELARLQRELRYQYGELRKLEELRDNLVHMVVHDMRSPLSVIKMALSVLQDKRDVLDEESQLDLQAASSCSDKLLVMVNNLLDLSRLESGNMPLHRQAINVSELIAEVAKSLEVVASDHALLVQPVDAGLGIFCDNDLIQRVAVNLISNALKFTPEGKRITVSCVGQDDGVRIAVADEGPGIEPEFHDRVFEKFGQASRARGGQPSTGLGLTFCKLAVESHGGKIGLESKPGEGSTFWFWLPDEASEGQVH